MKTELTAVGQVYSANCEYAVIQWLQQTSDVGGGDPKNSRSWPIAGDLVYLSQPVMTPVAWRYRMTGDLQWQYTERYEQTTHADEVQQVGVIK